MPSALLNSPNTTGLHTALPHLHATPPSPLPFLRGVVAPSFVLERAEGNVIDYHSPGVSAAREDILALGRPTKLLVNHWHEAMFDAPDLDVPVFVHEARVDD